METFAGRIVVAIGLMGDREMIYLWAPCPETCCSAATVEIR
jgi:hypothetical protein